MTTPRPESELPRRLDATRRPFGSRRTVHIIQAVVVAALLLPALATGYLSTGATADRSWFWQNQLPQGNPLRAMSWVGSQDGWSVGVDGTVLRTTDGGLNWIAQDAATVADLTGVSFVTTDTGWTVGISGTIKTTSNGGTTWTSQSSGVASNFRAVSFANSNIGVAVGDTGATTSTIRYTADGGATWRAAAATSTVGLSGVSMVSTSTGWAVGGNGTLLKTTNGGANWTVQPSPTTAGLAAISFAPGGAVGYFVGNAVVPNFTVYKTINSGATWALVSSLGTSGAINLFGVDCLDANNAVIVGANGQIRRTADGGTTWSNQSQNNVGAIALRAVKLFDTNRAYTVGDSGLMFYARATGSDSWFTLMQGSGATWFSVDFADVNHGWAVGTNGAIMRTADAGQTWEHQASGVVSWRAVRFTDTANGWIAGDGGAIKHTNNGVEWLPQVSGTTNQLNGLWFTSATTGFAVGNSGTILKTTDGGTTWVAKPSGTGQSLNAVWFATASTGYAVGAGGTVRKTTNGGETWNGVTSGTTQTLLTVRGADASILWIAGNGGTLRKTTNGGSNWSSQTDGAGTNPIRTVFFTSATTGWLGSGFGLVQTTVDGGTNWTAQNAGMPTSTLDPSTNVYASWFSGQTGYLVGDSGTVRRTLNGGANWTSLQYGTISSLNSVMFPDTSNGWASGTGGTMMRTSDGGQTWSQQKTGATVSLNQVYMTDSLSGWAVGDSGVIRRTVNGGLTWTSMISGLTVSLSSIGSGDPTHAIAAGSGAVKYLTANGSTWTSASVPPTQPVTGVYMVDANNAWAVSTRVSGNNVVWHTTNGGANWSSQATTANANLWDVYFLDVNTGYAVGDSGIVLKTTNGGTTWDRRPTPTTSPLYWIRFSDASTGWAVGGGGVAIRTLDGGATWTLRDSGTNQALTSVAFAGSRGWIVGVNGTILRNENLVPPVTTPTVNPVSPSGDNGWYTGTAPLITLTPSVGGSTYYDWVSAAGPFTTYLAPFRAIDGTQTLYYYSVDAVGNTEEVKSATYKTDITLPSAPSSVTASSITTSSGTISWTAGSDAVSGVAHYRVYRDGSFVTSTTAGSVSLTGLTPNTPYLITVRTVDVAGNYSDPSSGTALDTQALVTAPYQSVATVVPAGGANGANNWYITTAPTITLSSLPADANPRETYYSYTSDLGPWTLYTTTLTVPEGIGSLFFYTKDANATPTRFDEVPQFLLFQVDTQTPAQPTVTAVATSYQSIQASWTAVADTASGPPVYVVYVNGSFYTTVTAPIVDIIGLDQQKPYAITVRAVNPAGVSSPLSAAADTTTPPSPLPTPPAIAYAKAPTGALAYINWTETTNTVGAVSYRVWRMSSAETTYTAIATTTGGVSGCSYTDTGLRSSTLYSYQISAVDTRGESETRSPATAYTATLTLRPTRPTGVIATPLPGGVQLQWTASTNPAHMGYYVFRAACSLAATSTTITVVPTTANGIFDFTGNLGEPYYYTVAAIDASGAISWPSIEVEAKSIVILPGADMAPHEYGGNQSGCICHATHTAAGTDTLTRFKDVGVQTMCPTCHAPASAYQEFLDPLLKSKHAEGATVTINEPYSCITCHVPLHKAGTDPANLMRINGSSPCVEVTDTPTGNDFCYKCHGPGSTLPMGDLTAFESSGHRNIPSPPTGANITCDTCHESHASRNSRLLKYEGYMVCMQCHTPSASNPDEPDIYTRLTLNDGANSKHPLLPQDQATGARMVCQNCHNTHATTKAAPLVDPHNPGLTGAWTVARGDEKTFCFQCHDGQPLPSSAETTPWASAVLARNSATTVLDVQTLYQTSVHGFAAQSDSTTTTAYLRADMGYKYGDVLECRACHDPHGTVNRTAMNSDVKSANGSKTITGLLIASAGDGAYDYRFFCSSCHIWDSATHDSFAATSTVDFPTKCSNCHYFGSPVGGL